MKPITDSARQENKSRRRRAGVLGSLGVVAVVAAMSIPGAAFAQGGFSEKISPPGCTETTFSGGSSATSSGASGYSQRDSSMICGPEVPSLTVRLTLNGVTGSQQSTKGAYTNTTLGGPAGGTVSGRHTLAATIRTT